MQVLRKRTPGSRPATALRQLDLADVEVEPQGATTAVGHLLAVTLSTRTKDRHPATTRSLPVSLRDPRGQLRAELHRAQLDPSSSPTTRSENRRVPSRPVMAAAAAACAASSSCGRFLCAPHSPWQRNPQSVHCHPMPTAGHYAACFDEAMQRPCQP